MDGCSMAVLDECKVLSEGRRPKSMIEVSSWIFCILVAFQNLNFLGGILLIQHTLHFCFRQLEILTLFKTANGFAATSTEKVVIGFSTTIEQVNAKSLVASLMIF